MSRNNWGQSMLSHNYWQELYARSRRLNPSQQTLDRSWFQRVFGR
jgi:hypothetical protein